MNLNDVYLKRFIMFYIANLYQIDLHKIKIPFVNFQFAFVLTSDHPSKRVIVVDLTQYFLLMRSGSRSDDLFDPRERIFRKDSANFLCPISDHPNIYVINYYYSLINLLEWFLYRWF